MNITSLTLFDHFMTGYFEHGQVFHPGPRTNQNQVYGCSWGQISRPVGTFREECIFAAKLIQFQARDSLIYVPLSGGLDSQVVALSFLNAHIVFQPIIMVFNDDLNLHDVKTAFEFCRTYGLDPQVVFCDPILVLREMIADETHQIGSLEILIHLWLAKMYQDNFLVWGNGDPMLVLCPNRGWMHWEGEKWNSIHSYYQGLEHANGVPGFFQYTPELILSAYESGFLGSYTTDVPFRAQKHHLYQHSFGVTPLVKYTGFEMLDQRDPLLIGEMRESLREKFPRSNYIVEVEKDELIDHLRRGSPSRLFMGTHFEHGVRAYS